MSGLRVPARRLSRQPIQPGLKADLERLRDEAGGR